MRNYIIAANWKMNLNKNEAINLAKEIESNSNLFSQNVKVIVCTPYIHISDLVDYFNFSSIQVGAQNCNENEKGAFTGEISASMIKSYGCEYVILGHSERREIYNENNEANTINLSANGSKNWPKVELLLNFLAKYPSK